MLDLMRDSNFVKKVHKKLIYYYETYTGEKYNNNDINSIKDVVRFLNGEVVYFDIKDKFKVDKMLYLKENANFIIIIDNSLLNNNLIFKQKDLILDMMMKFIYSYIHINLSANTLIYPENSDIDEIEINCLLNKNKKIYMKTM